MRTVVVAAVSSGKQHRVHGRTPAPPRISQGSCPVWSLCLTGPVVQSWFCHTSASCLCLAQISPDPLLLFPVLRFPSVLRCFHSESNTYIPGDSWTSFCQKAPKAQSPPKLPSWVTAFIQWLGGAELGRPAPRPWVGAILRCNFCLIVSLWDQAVATLGTITGDCTFAGLSPLPCPASPTA